jgi:DNA-binding PadR family transcriptional regulator
MSGSEIAEEIEYYAEWKPSPGSIYPLLSSLQEAGFIEPNEDSDPSLKRFSLTEKGREELKAHREHDKEIRNRNKNMRKVYWRLFRRMPEDVYESFTGLLDRIEESFGSVENLDQFKEILDETLSEIEKLDKRQDE